MSNPVPDFVVEYRLKEASEPHVPLLDCQWDFEFLKGEQEYLIIERFQKQVEGLSRAIVDQLALR